MRIDINKFEAAVRERPVASVESSRRRRESRRWRTLSQDVALAVYHYLDRNGLTQKEFAESMGVSPAYVAKLLKGSENLTLETISKIEAAIGTEIVHIDRPYELTMTVSFTQRPAAARRANSRKYVGQVVSGAYSTINTSESYAV